MPGTASLRAETGAGTAHRGRSGGLCKFSSVGAGVSLFYRCDKTNRTKENRTGESHPGVLSPPVTTREFDWSTFSNSRLNKRLITLVNACLPFSN